MVRNRPARPATIMDEATPPPEPASTAPAGSSLVSRLFNVLAAPGEVFDEVRSSPPRTANWLVPALVLMVVGLAGLWLCFSQDSIQQQLSEFLDKTLAKNPAMGQMNEQARAMTEKFSGIVMKVSMSSEPVVTGFVMPFCWGLIIWVLGAKVFKGNFGFMKAVEVAGLTNVLAILEAVVKTLLAIALGNIWAGPHLGLMVKDFDPANPAHIVLAAINLISFWSVAVRAVGLAKLSGVSFAKAAAWLFGLWLVFSGGMIGFSLAMQHLGGR